MPDCSHSCIFPTFPSNDFAIGTEAGVCLVFRNREGIIKVFFKDLFPSFCCYLQERNSRVSGPRGDLLGVN